MTVVGVVADTHVPDLLPAIPAGALEVLRRARVEAILHAGDICRRSALAQLAAVARVIAVRGNRDLLWPVNWALPIRRVVELGGATIGLTHGHGGPATYALDLLQRLAKRHPPAPDALRLTEKFPEGVRVVVYGHTHVASIRWVADRLLFNPGSLVPARHAACGPTLGLLHIEKGAIRPEIVRVP